MFFNELYSVYYHVIALIIKEAIKHPISDSEIIKIIENNAFSESVLTILPALKQGKWPLLNSDGTTAITSVSLPLTILQKRWLKAIINDPRMKLFNQIDMDLEDVEPLFTNEDICIFDKDNDGDNYLDEKYQTHFKLILDAITNKYSLEIDMISRKGKATNKIILPKYLEYCEKDDKFRVIGHGSRGKLTINLGRITNVTVYNQPFKFNLNDINYPQRCIIVELVDKRNALQRVLLHFAHLKKQVEKLSDDTYRLMLYYNREDESEMVIRILSFGPMLKVVSPNSFIELIKQRLFNQKNLLKD